MAVVIHMSGYEHWDNGRGAWRVPGPGYRRPRPSNPQALEKEHGLLPRHCDRWVTTAGSR